MKTTTVPAVDVGVLRGKVEDMYRLVATEPDREFHFEMGRPLAERLGYLPGDLDRIPEESVRSFAGVGHYFDLAGLREGETVVDLGSGSGMDSFIAALRVGPAGRVIGIDMTAAQLEKSERLRARDAFRQVEFRRGYIEEVPLADGRAEAVISNGVINLSPDKQRVFREAARLLRPGGRLAIADIVTDTPLPESVTCDATLWAACIGGAMQQDAYLAAIEAAGLTVVRVVENPQYRFLSRSAEGASRQYGVKSVSVLAEKGTRREYLP